VIPAYYAQMVTDQLDLRCNLLEEISKSATHHDETQLRSVLGSFLFTGEDVYKKLSVLSGGEKSRVALAKILLKPSNLLLLDEPTNHLDLTSKEILLQALLDYEGTILFISHDRYFMDQLSQKVLELKDGVLTAYLGNYSEYFARVSAPPAPSPGATKVEQQESTFYKSKEQKKAEAQQRQQQSKMRKEVILPLQELEKKIAQNEARMRELETQLADDRIYSEKDRYHGFINEYQSLKKTLEANYAQWEELQRKKEQAGT